MLTAARKDIQEQIENREDKVRKEVNNLLDDIYKFINAATPLLAHMDESLRRHDKQYQQVAALDRLNLFGQKNADKSWDSLGYSETEENSDREADDLSSPASQDSDSGRDSDSDHSAALTKHQSQTELK